MLFDPLAPVRMPEEDEPGPMIGPAENSLDLLRQVYSDPGQPISRRMRAAIAALPFEHPKLAVTANIDGGPGFAARLEEAYARSRKVREANPRSGAADLAEDYRLTRQPH